jgi:hypothetical protein
MKTHASILTPFIIMFLVVSFAYLFFHRISFLPQAHNVHILATADIIEEINKKNRFCDCVTYEMNTKILSMKTGAFVVVIIC